MFSSHTKNQRHDEYLRGDRYVNFIDCGDGIMGVWYVQAHHIVYIKMCDVFLLLSIPQ